MLDILFGDGLFTLSWFGYVMLTLALTHVTIISVSLYLHRSQAHRSVEFHPAVAHFMRFWLWLTTGMITRQWVAVHRKHHSVVETREDPHSPRHRGLVTVLFKGTELYQAEAADKSTLEVYGQGTPDDWIENHLYTKHESLGILLLLSVQYLLFGFFGIAMWAIQMMWIPFLAAGVINGAAHAVGYRNFDLPDDSTNLVNVGLLIGGEELHNNHHAFPGSAKFSIKPWEFDAGWLHISIWEKLGLASVRRVAPMPHETMATTGLDLTAVKALFRGRVHVMADYVHTVMRPVFRAEVKKARLINRHHFLKNAKKSFFDHKTRIRAGDKRNLERAFRDSKAMATVYEFKNRLQFLWQEHRNDHEKLREALLEWCCQAERSGLQSLQAFAARFRGPSTKASA